MYTDFHRFFFSICAIRPICEPLISHADLANPANFLLPKDLYFAHRFPQIFFVIFVFKNFRGFRGFRCLIVNCVIAQRFACKEL